MTQLAQYERARSALAEASRIEQVLPLLDEIPFIKVYARQIQSRELMAEASALQLRIERRLGVLIAAAKDAGQLAERGGRKAKDVATLADIGVDRKLAAKAQRAAHLDDNRFEAIIETMREKMAAGKAIIVDPIDQAQKEDVIAERRRAHAERTRDGGCIKDLHELARSGYRAGSIGADPQWKFLTRSAQGDGRSANVHYKTEEVDKIKDLPVNQLLADDGAFYMWMVDWCPQDALDLLTHWGLRHVTTAFTWVKTNPSGKGWHMGQGYWTRANPEQCWLATKGSPKRLYADVHQLIVAPVMEHSRKPDEWLERIERLTEGPYLELNARRPRKGWMSWGDELEFTGVAA